MRYVVDDNPCHYVLIYVSPTRRFAQTRVERRATAPPWIEQLWKLLERSA